MMMTDAVRANRMVRFWLAKKLLSHLPEGVAELHLCGPGSDSTGYPGNVAKTYGFEEDLTETWRDDYIAICPIHQISGVNVKRAEPVFNGMPLLTRPLGARGLSPFNSARQCGSTRARKIEKHSFVPRSPWN